VARSAAVGLEREPSRLLGVPPGDFGRWQAHFPGHYFIFDNNGIQMFVTIGNNLVLWSGNHSKVGDHCFVSSHVVVSGFVEVGHSCFLGVNTTVANNTKIGNWCTVGAGALILEDVGDSETIVGIWKKRLASMLE
jgi:carbonic anhydrase/acetyltransferase-like protein (isoleucine patch superfamily)